MRQAALARQALHRHVDPRLVVFIAGEMREQHLAQAAHYVDGDFVLRPPFFAHANLAGEAGVGFVRLAVSRQRWKTQLTNIGWKAVRGRAVMSMREWRSVLNAVHGGDAMLDFVTSAVAASERPQGAMAEIASLLATSDAPSVSVIAHARSMHPYALSRQFRRVFGVAPAEFRRQARLQVAMKRLAEGDAAIGEVAQSAGFFDQSHLCRELKRETGLSPLAFRRQTAEIG